MCFGPMLAWHAARGSDDENNEDGWKDANFKDLGSIAQSKIDTVYCTVYSIYIAI